MKRRILLTVLLVPLVVWLQAWSLRRKVPTIATDQYEKSAVTLSVADGSRYGFIQGHHGATLVKAAAREDDTNQTVVEADPQLVSSMTTALEQLPRNAFLEGVFYVLVAAFLLLVAPLLIRLAAGGPMAHRRRAVVAGSLAATAMFLFLMPRTFLDYGASAFSTWAGPCPLSYSGPYARLSGVPGDTVSYRYLQEIVVLPVIAVGSVVGNAWRSASDNLAGLVVFELLHIGSPYESSGAVLYWLLVLGLPFVTTAVVEYLLARRRSA